MRRRVLIVTFRFWPLVDDGAMRLLHWAAGLQRHGMSLHVLTPRWHNSWPAEAVCREVPVSRLLPPPKTAWTQTHWLRSMNRWILQHRDLFDAIFVDDPFSTLHHLAQAKALRHLPLIGRFHVSSLIEQGKFDPDSTLTIAAEACRKLDWVVVPDAISDRRLRSSGIQQNRILRINDPSWNTLRREEGSQRAARLALAKVSGDMVLPSSHRLIVAFSNSNQVERCIRLAKSVGQLIDQGKKISLWFVGEGAYQRRLYEFLRDRSWHREIMMQGSFDAIDELLLAADLFVSNHEHEGTQFFFPTAIASGIPWLAPIGTELRKTLGNEVEMLDLSQGADSILEQKLAAWSDDPSPFIEVASIAKSQFVGQINSQKTIDQWMQFFSSLPAKV